MMYFLFHGRSYLSTKLVLYVHCSPSFRILIAYSRVSQLLQVRVMNLKIYSDREVIPFEKS